MNHPCGGGLKVKHKIHKYLSKKQQHKSPVITTTTTTKRAHFNYNKTTKIHGFDQSRSFYCSMSKSQADGNSQHIFYTCGANQLRVQADLQRLVILTSWTKALPSWLFVFRFQSLAQDEEQTGPVFLAARNRRWNQSRGSLLRCPGKIDGSVLMAAHVKLKTACKKLG